MIASLRTRVEKHQPFLILFLLFVSFRLLAIALFRPGGFIADNSDYEFYYAWGLLTPQGYRAYDNLWTAYPPLFPLVMLNAFELSSRIPPWVDPRLFFHTIFGLTLLIFESGNLILIQRLSHKLGFTSGENQASYGLAPATLYALLFVPVYTLIGWFESLPLFFMLLGLDLLISSQKLASINPTQTSTNVQQQPPSVHAPRTTYHVYLSAIAAALGFLTKLTPILLVPIAIRWLGSKLSLHAARAEWFNRRSPANLLRPTIYTLIFFGTVISIGIALIPDLSLTFNSFQVQGMRPPWQSVWALIDGDGFFGYGLVPVDMRNLISFDERRWHSQLPWPLISLAFLALYLWLYTRRYNWSNPRTPIAFAAISVIILFLYSKGWSPQFLLWILAFIVLLLPTLRGILIAIALSLINFVESNIFLILLPNEQWIMWGTVLLRTGFLIALLLEFLGQIWPSKSDQQITQIRDTNEPLNLRNLLNLLIKNSGKLRWISAALTILLLLGTIVGAVASFPRAASAYQARRFAESPCSTAITHLQEQAVWPNSTIITDQIDVWQEFYPWLHRDYTIHAIDTYSPIDQPYAEVADARLETIIRDQYTSSSPNSATFWLATKDNAPTTSNQPDALQQFFNRPTVHRFDPQTFGPCTLQRVHTNLFDSHTAQTSSLTTEQGGPIQLLNLHAERQISAGGTLHIELYWLTQTPLTESYTIFTQLLDPSGTLIAQQDNLPVEGLAPTNTWQPNTPLRDPFALAVPADAAAGEYQLLVGLYNEEGRLMLAQRHGLEADFVEVRVEVMH